MYYVTWPDGSVFADADGQTTFNDQDTAEQTAQAIGGEWHYVWHGGRGDM